jgi:hypothetical protein
MENKKLKLQVEDLLQEIERFKTALVRSEQRVKEVSEIPCKECP